MRDVPLYDIVSTILPDASGTALLQAALWGDEAPAAWERWRRLSGPLPEFLLKDRAGSRHLLSLLNHNLQRRGAAKTIEDGLILKAAATREEARFRAFASTARTGLKAFNGGGLEPLVLKGLATAVLYYPAPMLRHCHDLDLLASPRELSQVAGRLAESGFSTPDAVAETLDHRFVHQNGLSIECHAGPFAASCFPVDLAALMARSRPAFLLGARCRVLHPGDMLAQICGHAITRPGRRSLGWLADAYMVIKSGENPWPSFLESAVAMRLSLPALVILTYFREVLKSPVPETILTELRRESLTASRDLERVVIQSARTAGGRGIRGLWGSTGWKSRLAILRWALASEAEYLRGRYGRGSGRREALRHLVHPLRALRSGLRNPMMA